MCGIHIIIDKKKNISQDLIYRMTATTLHRGPDSTKCQILNTNSETFFLGSNRLKIMDQTESAAQPFLSPDLQQALLFNGEIFNFHNLKNELLAKGIRFTSHSDTEVLFHWLRTYGKAGIENLEGMFAFIFINLENREIFIARDRSGIKPLYYFEDENCFIASSEIKAIHNTGLLKKAINAKQVHHYLSYKYAKPPETFFQNIYELRHGTVMHFEKDKWEISSFYQKKTSKQDAIPDLEKIETLITNSLLQQLSADVPLGLLLSGGVDSTLLLALASKEGFQLPTYSIINTEADQSFGTKDYIYSKLAASIFGSIHHELEIDITLLNQFECFIDNLDQPIGDSAYLLTSEICKYASQSMKILLSGAGADELFAGYNRHKAFYTYLKNKKTFDLLSPFFHPILNSLPSGFPHPLRKKFKLIKKLSNAVDRSPGVTYHNFLTFEELRSVDSSDIFDRNESVESWLTWALNYDQKYYLVSDVLALSDKASMLHSIELRVPYLEENLIDYLSGLPSVSLIKHGQKWTLKEILTKYGGRKFVNRPKEGFGLPLSHWLMDKRMAHLWTLFESPDSIIFQYIDKIKIDQLLDQQKRKEADHGPLLWSILVLGHWLERNFS